MRRPDWFARPLAWFRDPFRLPAAPARSPGALPAYVALGHWGSGGAALEPRLELLVAQLAAELSACQWCIHQGRHRWLKAFLPAELLGQVRSYETSGLFSERERAALALTEAVAHHTEREPAMPQQAIARARRYFAEPELARIAAAAANEHFFDPATGAVGRDATLVSPSGVGGMPWRAIDAGISIRGLL
jgi:alkylhydroperoxidase family enzyme